jgi:hypothetical protein
VLVFVGSLCCAEYPNCNYHIITTAIVRARLEGRTPVNGYVKFCSAEGKAGPVRPYGLGREGEGAWLVTCGPGLASSPGFGLECGLMGQIAAAVGTGH